MCELEIIGDELERMWYGSERIGYELEIFVNELEICEDGLERFDV